MQLVQPDHLQGTGNTANQVPLNVITILRKQLMLLQAVDMRCDLIVHCRPGNRLSFPLTETGTAEVIFSSFPQPHFGQTNCTALGLDENKSTKLSPWPYRPVCSRSKLQGKGRHRSPSSGGRATGCPSRSSQIWRGIPQRSERAARTHRRDAGATRLPHPRC